MQGFVAHFISIKKFFIKKKKKHYAFPNKKPSRYSFEKIYQFVLSEMPNS